MNPSSSVSVQHLSKKYRDSDAYALKDFSLEISEGEIFGVLGPNGAGKTTFFSILCGLFLPSEGEVNMAGYQLSTELDEIKKNIGVVPQDIALYPTLSGRDNLIYIGRMYRVNEKLLKAKVDELLTFFGFDKNRNQPVKSYSGGMKRKINLMGGILHDPKILLLDEPTVGMDVQTRNMLMTYLKFLNKEKKMTIIYTSHYLEQAEQFCDRIAIIDGGKMLKLGSPKALIAESKLENLEALFLSLTGKQIRD